MRASDPQGDVSAQHHVPGRKTSDDRTRRRDHYGEARDNARRGRGDREATDRQAGARSACSACSRHGIGRAEPFGIGSLPGKVHTTRNPRAVRGLGVVDPDITRACSPVKAFSSGR